MRSCLPSILLVALLAQGSGAAARAETFVRGPCEAAIAAAERIERLPRHLLHAVSLAESGRWDARSQARIAWPWTVNNAGNAKFLPTRRAAVAEVRRLQAKGERNIDVGCMQVNLMHHGQAFASLEEAIDPIHNVAFAATLLKHLRDNTSAWAQAVGRYHSSRWAAQGKDYWRKVRALWIDEQRRDFRRRRAIRLFGRR